MSNGNREYKSDVFSMLMQDKANALSVYNINFGKNGQLLERCKVIRDYMTFAF